MASKKRNDQKIREKRQQEFKRTMAQHREPVNPRYTAMAATAVPEDGMVVARKPLTMFLAEACSVLRDDNIEFAVRAGKKRSIIRLIKFTTVTIYVPERLRGRAEWLFAEWLAATEYLRQVG